MRKQSETYQVGQGHGSTTSNLPVIREALVENMTFEQRMLLAQLDPGTRIYKMGKVKIIASPPIDGRPGWLVSVSHPDRYPTWDEVAAAWYGCVPGADERTGAMLLPPKADYINVHNFCFLINELGADGEKAKG